MVTCLKNTNETRVIVNLSYSLEYLASSHNISRLEALNLAVTIHALSPPNHWDFTIIHYHNNHQQPGSGDSCGRRIQSCVCGPSRYGDMQPSTTQACQGHHTRQCSQPCPVTPLSVLEGRQTRQRAPTHQSLCHTNTIAQNAP